MGLVKTSVSLFVLFNWSLPELPSYPQLVGTRVCLGVAEAGFSPGVVY